MQIALKQNAMKSCYETNKAAIFYYCIKLSNVMQRSKSRKHYVQVVIWYIRSQKLSKPKIVFILHNLISLFSTNNIKIFPESFNSSLQAAIVFTFVTSKNHVQTTAVIFQ